MARLDHSSVVCIHEFGETDDLHLLVTEYVDGSNLRQVLDAGGLPTARGESASAEGVLIRRVGEIPDHLLARSGHPASVGSGGEGVSARRGPGIGKGLSERARSA